MDAFPENFDKDLDEIMHEYMRNIEVGLNQVCINTLDRACNSIADAIKCSGNIFAFGNGGSHTEADAFLFALEKELAAKLNFGSYGCPKFHELLDTKNEEIFFRTINRYGKEGDAAILVTASGNSLNILNAAKACQLKSISTISVSGKAEEFNSISASSDHSILISLNDQQQIEEVTLAVLHIMARQIGLKLTGRSESIELTRKKYLFELSRGLFDSVTSSLLINLVTSIVMAFRMRKIVRVDATHGLLVSPAEHMAHNLQWDARDEVKEVWPNLVLTGLLPCHLTGVSNDGGCGYNNAIEVRDNCISGDVEIILTTDLEDIRTKSLINATSSKGVSTYVFYIKSSDYTAVVGIAQIIAHLTGRLTNTRLLLEQGVIESASVKDWMRTHDLALLRKKYITREHLENTLS